MSKKIWGESDNMLFLMHEGKKRKQLENAVYSVNTMPNGQHYLIRLSDKFSFDYKVYGIESDIINRTVKTYRAFAYGNLGIIFNGIKGTGKTVSAKLLCNVIDQPVLIVGDHTEGCVDFINSIEQNITVFIDEYEKVFGKSNDMLTIMDGAMNSAYRRLFILTTNNTYIEDNLLQRPGRVRYVKQFGNLAPDIVKDILEDVLDNKSYVAACCEFISTLRIITVDIVKCIATEVNIHDELPENFHGVMNMERVINKYNVFVSKNGGPFSKAVAHCRVSPSPHYDSDEHGITLSINGKMYGQITAVLSYNTIELTVYNEMHKPASGVKSKCVIKVEPAVQYNYEYMYSDQNESVISMYNAPAVDGLLAPVEDETKNAVVSATHLTDKLKEIVSKKAEVSELKIFAEIREAEYDRPEAESDCNASSAG